MNNIEKLENIGKLGIVRQRLGANNESDASCDEQIDDLTNSEIVGAICGWDIGDESWWYGLKSDFDSLEKLDIE